MPGSAIPHCVGARRALSPAMAPGSMAVGCAAARGIARTVTEPTAAAARKVRLVITVATLGADSGRPVSPDCGLAGRWTVSGELTGVTYAVNAMV